MTASTRSRSATTRGSSAARRGRARTTPADPRARARRGARRRRGGSASAAAIPARISVGRLGLDRPLEVVAEQPEPAQIALVAAEALVRRAPPSTRPRSMYAFGSSAVACGAQRYVTASMNVGPSPARAARDRLARRLVDGEHVAAVDARARNPVAGRLVDERLGLRLRRERRRDRPLVVVAEEDERRAHHGGEVRALVEGALGGGAVAEERRARRRARRFSRLPQASPAACGTWVAIGTQIEARL